MGVAPPCLVLDSIPTLEVQWFLFLPCQQRCSIFQAQRCQSAQMCVGGYYTKQCIKWPFVSGHRVNYFDDATYE